jgi:cytochrome c oxidase assembly factor CtaG
MHVKADVYACVLRLFYYLFYNAVIESDYMNRMLEWLMKLKEGGRALVELLTLNLPGRLEENYETSQSG